MVLYATVSAVCRGFDGWVVVIKIMLGDGGKLALEMAGEWNAKCHGPKCPFEVYLGPIGSLWNVRDRVNDVVPDRVMVSALIGVQP